MNRRLYFVGALIALLVGARAALPHGIAWLIEREGTEALGLPVTVTDVDLVLHRGQLTVEGLEVGGDQAPHLRSERILADLHVLDLFRRHTRLERLELGHAQITLALLEDGTLAPLARSEAPGEPAEVSAVATGEEGAEVPNPTDVETAEVSDPVATDEEMAEVPDPVAADATWPFSIDQLEITDFELLLVSAATGDAPPLEVSFERFRFSDFTVIDGALSLGSVGLEGSRARLRRDLVFVTADAAELPPATSPQGAPPSRPRLALGNLSIEDAQLQLASGEVEVEVAFSVQAQDISFEPGARFPAELNVRRGDGALDLVGRAGANPPAFDGTASLDSLSVANLFLLVDPNIPLRVDEGTLGGEFSVSWALGAAGAATRLDGHLEVGGIEGDADGRDLALTRARLEARALAFTAENDATGVTATSLVLHGEGLSVHDTTVDPTFLLNLVTLDGTARGLRWPAGDAEFELEAKGIQGFRATASGELASGRGRTELALENVSLADLSGYVVDSGIRFDGGTAGLDGRIDSDEARHELDLELELGDLEASTVDPDVFQRTFGMAPDVALALMRDPSGAVDVPLYFEIDRTSGGTDFSRRRLLTSVVRQAVTGVGLTPLKSLAFAKNVVFRDDGTLAFDPIRFESGADQWAPGQDDYLDALARMLTSRPGLSMQLTGRADDDEAQPLALERATRVAKALEARRVPAARLVLAKPQEGQPVVEITVVPTLPAVSSEKE